MGNEYKSYNYGSEEVPDPQSIAEFRKVHEERKKRKRRIKLTLILVLVLLISGCQISNFIKNKKADNLLEQFLEQKYGEDFVMGRSEKLQGAIGSPVFRKTYYRLKENNKLKFYATATSPPNLDNPEDKKAYEDGSYYGDNYLDVMWNIEYKKDMEPLMKEWFGDEVIFNTEIYIADRSKYQCFGRTPSYKEFIEGNKAKVSQIEGEIYLDIHGEVALFIDDEYISDKTLKKVFPFIQYYKNQNAKYKSIWIGFYSIGDETEVRKLERKRGEIYQEKYIKEMIIINAASKFEQIETIEDLKEFIQTVEDLGKFVVNVD